MAANGSARKSASITSRRHLTAQSPFHAGHSNAASGIRRAATWQSSAMLIELRVLLGPNADIPAPAIRVTLAGPTEPGVDLCDVTDRIARAADAYVGPAVSRTGRATGPWSWPSPGCGRGPARRSATPWSRSCGSARRFPSTSGSPRPPRPCARADPGDPPQAARSPGPHRGRDRDERQDDHDPAAGTHGRRGRPARRLEQHRRGVRGGPVHRAGGLVRARWRPHGRSGSLGWGSPSWRPPAAA